MTKQRVSSFELIRLICIFFVIFWHSIGPYLNDLTGANMVDAAFIHSLTNNTNLLFMMVSGYFGIRFHMEKLVKLDLAIIFYDVLYLILVQDFSARSILGALLPITLGTHWFITNYFIIAIFSGFLNRIPEKLSQKDFRNLLLLLFLIFYILPTIFFHEYIEDTGKGIVCMTIMYFVGRYIKLYWSDRHFSKIRLAVVFFSFSVLATGLNLVLSYATGNYMSMYSRDNSILTVITAVSFFLFLREFHFSSRLINHLAPNVVMMYCIEAYGRNIAGHFFDLGKYTNSPHFILPVTVFAIIVLIGCLVVNELRRLLFDRLDGFLAHQIMRPVNAVTPAFVRLAHKVHDTALHFLVK